MATTNKKLKITQINSQISRPETQGKTLEALGLGKVGKTATHDDNPAIRGQIFKIKHLVKVEEIN